MKQKKLTIPKSSSIQEEARFWDTHDATDYFDQMENVKAKFVLKSPKAESVTIRLQPEIKRRLVKAAKKWGVSSPTLIGVLPLSHIMLEIVFGDVNWLVLAGNDIHSGFPG